MRQVVRHTMRRRSARADLAMDLSAHGVAVTLDVAPGTDVETHRMVLTALDERAAPTQLPTTLERIGPDRYRAVAHTEGQPIVVARLMDREGRVIAEASAQDASLSEHSGVGADARALRELARLGGGGVIETPAEALSPASVARPRQAPTWPWLFLAAAFLVVLDLWARRLGRGTRRVAIVGLTLGSDEAGGVTAPTPPQELDRAA